MKQVVITQDQWVHDGTALAFFLPPSIGRGRMTVMACQSGLRVLISDYMLNEPACMAFSYAPVDYYGFGFCLSGSISNHLSAFAEGFPILPGQSVFLHAPEHDRMVETVGTNRVCKVNIIVSPGMFQETALFRKLPHYLRDVAPPCRIPDTITPAMQRALLDMFECPYQGITRNFFLEAKAMELVAYKLEQLFYKDGLSPGWSQSVIRDEDIDRMREVAKIITSRLNLPPSLSELAKSAGICRSKLHKCFKQVYGMTPFDFARAKRLEQAERLLRRGDVNITQTAFQLGYSSPSHFAKAFKQYFGYPPLQCRKK